MTDYLSYTFEDNEEFINTFDELPLWSASFGLMLLKYLPLKPHLKVIDIGSGAGFPLMELAGRLGNTCQLYGVDTWATANIRARQKVKNYELKNVEVIEGSAESLPFEDNMIDLIVSNLGINNFDQPNVVFKECQRVLKVDGKLALTTNVNGHWKEFYRIFEDTLVALNKTEFLPKLIENQTHRGTVASVSQLFTDNGFKICKTYEDTFEMRFLDGTAFLNHYFIKLGWLNAWMSLFPKEEWKPIFQALEERLNVYAKEHEGLSLTVPMLYMEGEKIIKE